MYYLHSSLKSSKNNYGSKGFTLIEVMISLAIFVFIMTIAAGSILSIIDADRKAHKAKSVIDNLSFAVDDMVRNIRTGRDYRCTTSGSTPDSTVCNSLTPAYEISYIPYAIPFTNNLSQDSVAPKRVAYSFAFSPKQIFANFDADNPNSNWEALTAPEVTIDPNSHFYVTRDTGVQSSVEIVISGHAGEGKFTTPFVLQTSVTKRFGQ